MRVAIVHDWLTGMRGGERCLLAFLQMYPAADLYTLLHVPGAVHPRVDQQVAGTSFLQKLPGIKRYYRLCLPLYPWAARSITLSGYDLVISLSHAAAKNVSVPPGTPHICYCFTPMRYIWDQAQEYFGVAAPALWPLLSTLRRWDIAGSKHVTHFVAISRFVAARIRLFYGRRSDIIYPPVDASWIKDAPTQETGKAFLCAGALVPYKRVDLAVRAFSIIGEPLLVAGSGPEESRLRKLAGSNVTFLGRVSDSELASLYASCRALIFPGTEDFGLIPIECMAAGRPVIALYDGAAKDTIQGVRAWRGEEPDWSRTGGVYFQKVQPSEEIDAMISAVYYFIEHEERFSASACMNRAADFSPQRFFQSWVRLLETQGLVPMPVHDPE